jgi:hypothetical protein
MLLRWCAWCVSVMAVRAARAPLVPRVRKHSTRHLIRADLWPRFVQPQQLFRHALRIQISSAKYCNGTEQRAELSMTRASQLNKRSRVYGFMSLAVEVKLIILP